MFLMSKGFPALLNKNVFYVKNKPFYYISDLSPVGGKQIQQQKLNHRIKCASHKRKQLAG